MDRRFFTRAEGPAVCRSAAAQYATIRQMAGPLALDCSPSSFFPARWAGLGKPTGRLPCPQCVNDNLCKTRASALENVHGALCSPGRGERCTCWNPCRPSEAVLGACTPTRGSQPGFILSSLPHSSWIQSSIASTLCEASPIASGCSSVCRRETSRATSKRASGAFVVTHCLA